MKKKTVTELDSRWGHWNFSLA